MIVVHDLRVGGHLGGVGRPYDLMQTTGNMPLDSCLSEIVKRVHCHSQRQQATPVSGGLLLGGLPQLTIFAHALDNGPNDFRVLLCAEGITLATVGRFRLLSGLVGQINLTSCGAARGQGHEICVRLAQVTNSLVLASTQIQAVNPQISSFGLRILWAPPVFRYRPDGSREPLLS
jgi:hypothetical protein